MSDTEALELGRQLLAQREADNQRAGEVRAELHAAIDDLSNERLLVFGVKYTGACSCPIPGPCICGRRGKSATPHDGLLDWLTRHTEA